MCGLPVVVKSDLKGGGRDYLDTSNAIFFDDYESASTALIKAVDSYQQFDLVPVIELNEKNSISI